jgi:hypothetical protein
VAARKSTERNAEKTMTVQLYRTRPSRRPDGDQLCGQSNLYQPVPKAEINVAFNVRRDERGAIDMVFYKTRGQRLRQEAMAELARSIRDYGLTWLRGWRKSASRCPWDHGTPGLGNTIPTLALIPAVHMNYAETVLPMRDGLPKLKDFPAEFGGSGQRMAE